MSTGSALLHIALLRATIRVGRFAILVVPFRLLLGSRDGAEPGVASLGGGLEDDVDFFE